MTHIDREKLIEKLNEQVRDNGNINVLLVHAIAQHVHLSASEFECASLIRDHGPFTAGELAKRCRISTGGMTGMIDRLVRAKLVERVSDPKDRRRVLVSGVETNSLNTLSKNSTVRCRKRLTLFWIVDLTMKFYSSFSLWSR